MMVCLPFCNKAQSLKDSVLQKRNVGHYEMQDTEGKTVKLSDFNGNYVFMEMWSMSCPPCLREMPYFHKLSKIYSDKPIKFVSICVENNHPAWVDFLKRKEMPGIQWRSSIKSAFLVENRFYAVPRFVMLDKEGNILWNKAAPPSDPSMEVEIGKLFL